MSLQHSVQPVDACHATVIAALHGECFEDQPWDHAAVSEILAMPGAFGHLLLLEGEPSGFVIGWIVADECEILSLAVQPLRRRRGFGRFLLEAALSQAVSAGCVVAHLEVSEANSAGRLLYESLGFRRNGERAGYYATAEGTPAAALLLSRRLP